ncbi:MAG: SDR family oxidoreductase [Blastocatellia bacterium]|nr:SDR family oxidoreductase [Blastocatellia bacterium]
MKKALVFGAGSDMFSAIKDILVGHKVMGLTHEECDVNNWIEVVIAMEKAKPNVVINLAGVSWPQPMALSEPGAWLEEINTNLIGSFNVARACIPDIVSVQDKVKTMIFMGSVAGLHGKQNHTGYSASKAGVHSLVQSLAAEGYNAYAIAPGRVNTKMRERDFPGEDTRTRLTTEQIAEVVRDIVDGKYKPGDIAIIRKIGYKTHKKTYRGQPWRKWLKIQPWEEWSGF